MFGDIIQELRKEYKISQEQLAEIMSTTRQAVSKWERGESYPDLDRLKDLAIYFNVSIDYLLEYDIESTSVKNFISRLHEANTNKTLDITEEEIKIIVSKNNNNFNLIIAVIEYLIRFSFNKKMDSFSELVLEYTKRALEIFPKNNNCDVKEKDLHDIIILFYTTKKRYDLAKQYIVDNKISTSEYLLSEIEFELGNYEEASKLVSNNYIDSVQRIMNGNIIQTKLLVKQGNVAELYDLANFTISLIQLIQKDEDFLGWVSFLFNYCKAVCEFMLGKDYLKSVNELVKKYEKGLKCEESTSSLKFFYNDDYSLLVGFTEIKETLETEIETTIKGTIFEEPSKSIFKLVFGGK